MSVYKIGDVSRLTGTNISTLRLWEQHGLLVPARTDTGQRIYSTQDLERVAHIQRLRSVDGLNMSAIRRVLAEDGAPAAPPSVSGTPGRSKNQVDEPGSIALGHRFRAARQQAGLSLKEAADATELPVSFISTFERTGRGATVTSLKKLATCYGTSVTALSGAGRAASKTSAEVVRKGKEPQAPQFGPGIRILQLASSLPSLDVQKWILQPGARSEGSYSHHGEEAIHVLAGELSVTVDLAPSTKLRAGDTISFMSERPHSWIVTGDEPAVLIWVNTPKSF